MQHELRTPLNAIISYSDMLIEDFEDNDVCDDLNGPQPQTPANYDLWNTIWQNLIQAGLKSTKAA